MSDAEVLRLYSGRILALAADLPHPGRLPEPQASVTRRSPLCGSKVTVDVTCAEGRIAAFAQEVRACALGQAAAAVVGGVAVGLTRAEVEDGRDALRAMLVGGPVPQGPFAGFEALLPARDHRNRHASILLSIEALAEALAQAHEKAATPGGGGE